MTTIIEAQNVTRVFTTGTIETRALHNVNLTIHEGEFTCLMGWSGSGKTTLLNIIGALDEPTEGSIFVQGNNPNTLSDAARSKFRLHHIGFVFQAYNLVPVLTGFENAAMLLELQGASTAQQRERVVPLLETLGIASIMDKLPSQMSGGQQQRFAVARAIAPRPAIILADEPTANLDSETSIGLLDMMEELNKSEGITIVFSSHDSLVHERARRTIELRDGEVFADNQAQ